MSDIIGARALLEDMRNEFAGTLLAERIEVILGMLYRRPYKRHTAPKSKFVDAEMAKAIRKYARDNPTASNQDIGVVFGCNAGRVSEALHRMR
jgi:hypothetical protein